MNYMDPYQGLKPEQLFQDKQLFTSFTLVYKDMQSFLK